MNIREPYPTAKDAEILGVDPEERKEVHESAIVVVFCMFAAIVCVVVGIYFLK